MDLSWIAAWFDTVTGFFQAAWNFIDSGIYDLIKDGLVVLTKAMIYGYIQAKIFVAGVAYDVVKDVLTDSGVTATVQSMWGSIPGDIQSTLAYFCVPQGLSLIFAAIPTRWAMKFVPGIGG